MCKSMNQAQLKAMLMIVKKLGWNDMPACEVIEKTTQMVRNQQALELDTVGECDDEEETLLSIALWDKDKIISTMYVSSYQDLVMWGVECFKEAMGLDSEALTALWNWEACKYNFLAPEYEAEDIAYEEYLNEYYSDYDAEMLRETMWITKHC